MSKGKKTKHTAQPTGEKRTNIKENPEGYLDKRPLWAFYRCDLEHPKWSIMQSDFNKDILNKLHDYESMKWKEILSASGGRAHGNNNHFIKVNDLIKEAQQRLIELKLDDLDEVFSLRLTATKRLFGILPDGVFRILWYDGDHEIYKYKK